MNCPRCSNTLEVSEVDGVEVEVCLSCKGTWFDNDELRQAKDVSEPDAAWMDFDIWKHADRFTSTVDDIRCPRCDEPLRALSYDNTNVQIDVCSTCRGVWLDASELRHLVEALIAEIDNKSFDEYLSATLQEALEVLNGPESFVSEWKDFIQVFRLLRVRLYVEHTQIP